MKPRNLMPKWSRALLLMGVLVWLGGCQLMQGFLTQQPAETCAQQRLDAANVFYQDAKNQFMAHMQERTEMSLQYAYHASTDSTQLAQAVRLCQDATPTLVVMANELMQSNALLRELVMNNMRDQDPEVAIGLFGMDYTEMFRTDIN